MDGHNSYIIIAHCMKHVIHLFILFLYTSHLFQPLDVNVFMFLKYILIKKTSAVSKFDFNYTVVMI